jgi:hypothetical protein
MFFVGARFRPKTKCRNRQRRDFSLRRAGHFPSPMLRKHQIYRILAAIRGEWCFCFEILEL